ncbi:SDR family NAD(P)-dependent oxidoreductase, partial [Streptomyces nigra]
MREAFQHQDGRTAHAAIVNTCSVAATAGLPQRALYSASKGAVH